MENADPGFDSCSGEAPQPLKPLVLVQEEHLRLLPDRPCLAQIHLKSAEAPQRKRAADGLSSAALTASATGAGSFLIRSTRRGGVLFVFFSLKWVSELEFLRV